MRCHGFAQLEPAAQEASSILGLLDARLTVVTGAVRCGADGTWLDQNHQCAAP